MRGRQHACMADQGMRPCAHAARPHLEKALGRRAARVHHALGDALPVKLRELLHQLVVLQQDGAARADGERGVVVPDGRARVGCEVGRVERRARAVLRAGEGCWRFAGVGEVDGKSSGLRRRERGRAHAGRRARNSIKAVAAAAGLAGACGPLDRWTVSRGLRCCGPGGLRNGVLRCGDTVVLLRHARRGHRAPCSGVPSTDRFQPLVREAIGSATQRSPVKGCRSSPWTGP
jgi:hypothetical protein